MSLQRQAAQRLSLIPSRTAAGPRGGARLGSAAQQAGDLFWRCGVECFKPVYARLDARFPLTERTTNPKAKSQHANLMDEAKRILQENRNLILECVLPMFSVGMRVKGEEPGEADEHAHDFFCQNLFPTMIDTLIATLPTFCADKDDEKRTAETVANLAQVQAERLSKQLLNFAFKFKRVLTPQEIEKAR